VAAALVFDAVPAALRADALAAVWEVPSGRLGPRTRRALVSSLAEMRALVREALDAEPERLQRALPGARARGVESHPDGAPVGTEGRPAWDPTSDRCDPLPADGPRSACARDLASSLISELGSDHPIQRLRGRLRSLRAERDRTLPSPVDVFSCGSARIPSPLALHGVLAALRDGQNGGPSWRAADDSVPEFPYDQPQGAMVLSLRPHEADGAVGSPLAATLWQAVRQFTDLDGDVLLVLLAHALDTRNRGPDGSTWITADRILDYRGVVPKKKTEGRKRYRAGHRHEDIAAVAACARHLADQWVDLLSVERLEPRAGRREPTKARYTLAGRLVSVEEVVRRTCADGTEVEIGWRYRLGGCFTDFLDPPNRQVTRVPRGILRYDPKARRWEKRLALYLVLHIRIAERYRPTVRRAVATLIDECRLHVDRRNPERARRRFEQAMDRLIRDGVIAAWAYTPESVATVESLPSRGWLATWLSCVIEVAPVAPSAHDGIADSVQAESADDR
jgi:hypothetical protein